MNKLIPNESRKMVENRWFKIDDTSLQNDLCVVCVYVKLKQTMFKYEITMKNQRNVYCISPSGRFNPPAEVARFFVPSLSSRSELRRDSCVAPPPPYETFVMEVERRFPQYELLGATKFTSTGSKRRGVDEPNANAIELRSLRRFVSSRESRSWFFFKIYSRRSRSASSIAFFRSSTFEQTMRKINKNSVCFLHKSLLPKL